MRTLQLGLLCGAAFSALTLWAPTEAEACGGTFCDNGPQAMPVDQTGEKILFVMDEDRTEAHIQIQYDPDTDAAKFAWVIPITEVPVFSVGSDRLFDNVLAATVPAYGFTTSFDDCGDSGGDGTSDGGDGGGDGTSTGAGTGGGGPDVVLEETVGAFDIVVLSGGTAQEVMDWLAANDYYQDPNAMPILGDYLAEGYLFAAFKLTTGADLEEIHPVVLEFSNQEACIPLRLTRIAAVENMEVRTFFLSDQRIVPRNYKHVLVNPLKLDWLNFVDNYKEVITMAVDNAAAEGKAFVTEYAGDSDIVDRSGLYSVSWNANAITGAEAKDVVDTLTAQGIMDCDPFGGSTGTGGLGACEYYHPLIQGLLHQYIPVPMSLDEDEFYGCLSCYEGLIDQGAWDADAFVLAYQERIIDPGQHAWNILGAYPFLTRMYTTISPAEMTEDPFFYGNPDLAEVDLRNEMGNNNIQCDGDSVFTLTDGREVFIPNGVNWPDFPDEMPWAEDVEKMLPAGAPESLQDNTDQIDVLLREYNCQYDWPSPEACGGSGTGDSGDGSGSGTDGGSASGGSASATAGDASGSATGGDTDGGDAGQDASAGRGCACTLDDSGPAGLWILMLGLGALGRHRRRAA